MTPLLATAFAAGLVATVNPCGFAMLPAYLSYFLGDDVERSRPAALVRALRVGGLVSAGFVVVFGLAGVLLTAGVQAIIAFLPWLAVAIGVLMIGFGIAVLRGRSPTVVLGSGRVNRSSVFAFGVSYAVASLSCTLPIFLSLVAGAFTQTTLLGGATVFVAYAAGMSLVLTAITVTMAFGKDRLVRFVRGSARYVSRISGGILIVAGLFIIWYWTTILASGSVALGSNPLVRWVDGTSSAITSAIAERPVAVAAGLLVVVALAVFAARRSVLASADEAGETSRLG